MKFCVDCRHYGGDAEGYALCTKQCGHAGTFDLVTGRVREVHWRNRARLQREDSLLASLINRSCGKRAKWFEPKEI
jgi:hypothetical protein